MSISCLIVTGHSDLPETHLIIGLFRSGINIKVLCPDSAPHKHLLIDSKVPVYDLALRGRFDYEGIKRIRQHLRLERFDVLHTFNNKTLSNSLIAAKGYDCKIVAYRGIEGNVSYYDPLSWTTYLHPRISTIVCVADAIRKYFWDMRFFGVNFSVKKAITIYKGHDSSWYKDSIPLHTFNIPEGAFVVGCTVNDRPRKGLSYLIAATKQLPQGLPIHFVLIGKISDKTLLESIKRSPYANKIHLLGFQPKASAIIRNCDVCILPAIKREGLPKAVIEGMIQGVAPIVTNSGGSPELIENGISGLIIPPKSSRAIADAISEFYENRRFLSMVKSQSVDRIVKHFSIEETISKHVDLYQKLVHQC